MNKIEPNLKTVTFSTMSGDLIVNRKDDLYFPAYDLKPVEITDAMVDAIGAKPVEAYMGRDLLCVFDDEKTVRELKPNLDKLNKNSIKAYEFKTENGQNLYFDHNNLNPILFLVAPNIVKHFFQWLFLYIFHFVLVFQSPLNVFVHLIVYLKSNPYF